MPSSLRPVPWADEKEWRNVYADLYAPADGTIRRQRGVQRVKTWRSRGKVPHAADVTASFVEVQLRDERNEDLKGSVGERSAVTDHELRLMYTMVFIRFVNGLVDPEQKSQYARSVASIAEQLNLPAWFVDLRHAGTHDKLPSLPLLRSGCRQALDWLNSFYWRVRADEESRAMAEVEDLLEEFSAAVNAMLDEGKVAGEPGSTKAVASKLLSLGGWRRHIVSGTLRPGRLLPPKRAPREAVHARLSLWATLVKRLNEVWPHFSANLIADAADIVWGKRVATGQPVLAPAHVSLMIDVLPLRADSARVLIRGLLETPAHECVPCLSALGARFPEHNAVLESLRPHLSSVDQTRDHGSNISGSKQLGDLAELQRLLNQRILDAKDPSQPELAEGNCGEEGLAPTGWRLLPADMYATPTPLGLLPGQTPAELVELLDEASARGGTWAGDETLSSSPPRESAADVVSPVQLSDVAAGPSGVYTVSLW